MTQPKGRHEQAVTSFQRAIALFPEWGAAHYALALSLRSAGAAGGGATSARAARAIRRAMAGRGRPVLARVNAARKDPAARLRRAQKLADDGDAGAAIAEYEAALAADPHDEHRSREPDQAVRRAPGLAEGRGALPRRAGPRRRSRRASLRLRRAARHAGTVGRRGQCLSPGDRDQPTLCRSPQQPRPGARADAPARSRVGGVPPGD